MALCLVVALAAPVSADELSADEVVLVADAADGRPYRVTGIVPAYASEHPGHPDLELVLAAEVELGQVDDGYVAPRPGVPTVRASLRELADGRPGVYYASALSTINRSIVAQLNRMGLGGVVAQTDPDDIDPETGEDLRPQEEGPVGVEVLTGTISDLRVLEVETFCFGERCAPDESAGNPIHERIKEGSPIQPTSAVQPGETDLLRTDLLEDYVAQLNRHPGRRVVAEISPSRIERGTAYLDYKVIEDRPWAVYTQGSNTGTKETQHWRQRSGFRHTQLTNRDDVLRLDWVADGDFSEVTGLFGSYELPVPGVDLLRWQFNAAYSDYDASEVGVSNIKFDGKQHVYGSQLAYNVFQERELFVDLVGGARWNSAEVTNKAFNTEGHARYWLPHAGFRVSRETDVSTFHLDAGVERSIDNLKRADLTEMGRLDPNTQWTKLRYGLRWSSFLDPALSDVAPGAFDPARRGHEFILELRGQEAFDARLIPQEEMIAGGFYTIRGYPQAALAGDSVTIVRSEYKVHIPRLLGVRRNPSQLPGVGEFKVAPQHPAGLPDWDFTFSLFADVGKVRQSQKRAGEVESSMFGWGFGLGLQMFRNVSVNYYLGVVGKAIDDPTNPNDRIANHGDTEQHIEFTLMF